MTCSFGRGNQSQDQAKEESSFSPNSSGSHDVPDLGQVIFSPWDSSLLKNGVESVGVICSSCSDFL